MLLWTLKFILFANIKKNEERLFSQEIGNFLLIFFFKYLINGRVDKKTHKDPQITTNDRFELVLFNSSWLEKNNRPCNFYSITIFKTKLELNLNNRHKNKFNFRKKRFLFFYNFINLK